MSKTKAAKTKKTAPKHVLERLPKALTVAELHAAARLARRSGDVETAAKLTEQAHVQHAESKR